MAIQVEQQYVEQLACLPRDLNRVVDQTRSTLHLMKNSRDLYDYAGDFMLP